MAGRTANKSVLLRQRSLSLDNDKPQKKTVRALFPKLWPGKDKAAPVEFYEVDDSQQQDDPDMHKQTTAESAAPIELKGIMNELRRSSDVFRAILWNLSFRDMYSGTNDSDLDGSIELDVNTLFNKHEQRRYADYEQEHGGMLPLLDSLSSLQSFQSLSSTGSPATAAVTSSVTAAASDPTASLPVVLSDTTPPTLSVDVTAPLTQQSQTPPPFPPPSTPPQPPQELSLSQPTTDNDDTHLTVVPKLIFKSSLSLDKINEIAHVYTSRYLTTLPPLFLAVVRQNPTIIYLLLKFGAATNTQVSHFVYFIIDVSDGKFPKVLF